MFKFKFKFIFHNVIYYNRILTGAVLIALVPVDAVVVIIVVVVVVIVVVVVLQQ